MAADGQPVPDHPCARDHGRGRSCAQRAVNAPALLAAQWLFLVGSVLFPGALYALAFGGPRWMGAVAPIGGAAFILGWLKPGSRGADEARGRAGAQSSCSSRSLSASAAKARMLATRSFEPVRKRARDLALGADDGDAGVAGGVAVGIAGRPRRAGLGQAPGRVQPLAHQFGGERRPRLGGRADAGALLRGRGQEGFARRARVDHGAAHEVGRGAGHGEQHGGDQAAGRRFGDADRFLAGLQFLADLLGQRQERIHSVSPSSW